VKGLIAGVAVVALGLAGLIRGAVPQSAGSPSQSTSAIVVSDAWIAAPVPPTQAAAGYFTAYNSTNEAQTLLSVVTGAGESNVLHTANMSAETGGVVIPARGRLVLSPGNGHVMITQLIGTVKAGQNVSMQLTFENLPPVAVTATVYAPGEHP
jgi:hypothetical protein